MTIESVVFKDFNIAQNRGRYVTKPRTEDVVLVSGGVQQRLVRVMVEIEPEDYEISFWRGDSVCPAVVAFTGDDKYKLVVYAGPAVINDGRTPREHLCDDGNYHVHFRLAGARGSNGDIRINCATLEEVNGEPIPRDLRKYLRGLDDDKKAALTMVAKTYYEKGNVDGKEVGVLRG